MFEIPKLLTRKDDCDELILLIINDFACLKIINSLSSHPKILTIFEEVD